jgi:muramidase (phage lysozyme)
MVDMKLSKNMRAFLDTIAYSEGTDNGRQPTNNHGYDVVVGGSLFTDYSDHPRKLVRLKSLGISSTAAGRYQILKRYYDHYKAQLKLPDFSPASQDKMAIQLIRECGAYADIEEGRIETALHKCRSRWASLPGAGYGQHEYSMQELLDVYRAKLV